MKYSKQKDLKEINEFRQAAGLPGIVTKMRKCLGPNHSKTFMFISNGIHNRLCPACLRAVTESEISEMQISS